MLSSLQNPTIKLLRKLHQAQDRREQGLFLVEGTHLIEESLQADWPLKTIFYTVRWINKHGELAARMPNTVEQILVSDQVMGSLATTQNPDGVLGVAYDQRSPQISHEVRTLAIGMDRLQNPDNLGSLIRTSAAVGADGIWLGEECVDRTNPKVLRASVGQWFRQPPSSVDLLEWIKECKEASIQVLGATADGASCWEMDLTKPTVFILGNEGAGISEPILHLLDGRISVPMAAGIESLNVGVAGAVLLYEAARQRKFLHANPSE